MHPARADETRWVRQQRNCILRILRKPSKQQQMSCLSYGKLRVRRLLATQSILDRAKRRVSGLAGLKSGRDAMPG